MKTHSTHISAPPGELYWRRSVPASASAKMLLHTIGGVAVVGHWYGALDEYFTAWCPLPANSLKRRNRTRPVVVVTPELELHIKQLERELRHWKANHADIVRRAALLAQRSDLPVDRLPAYREMVELQLSLKVNALNSMCAALKRD